jgi:hypothetical protein
MQPQTARYLDLALLGCNDWWRYALGVSAIVLFWLVLGYLPLFVLPHKSLDDLFVAFVVVNFSMLMMLAGLAIATKWIHRRPLSTLVTPEPRIDWRRMVHAAAVWAAFSAISTVVEQLVYPGRYHLSFDPQRFFVFAVLVVVLTPIQSATEELVFRGYVAQGLSRLGWQPALIAIASSALFAAPHLMNPEVRHYGVAVMAANYFAIGMVLSVVALRDGRLELAIGLHAANNMFLALAASYEDSVLPSAAIVTAREVDPWFSLVSIVAGGALFYWWFFGRARRMQVE